MIERYRYALSIVMMCRLLQRIHALHAESNSVFGRALMQEELRYQCETCRQNRVARLMQTAGLVGIPVRSQWRKKSSGARLNHVTNHWQRDFTSQLPSTKWVTDITCIRTAESWLYLAMVIDLYSSLVID